MSIEPVDGLLDRMFRPNQRGMRSSVSRALGPLVEAGVLTGLCQLNRDSWTTAPQLPEWSRSGDVHVLQDWSLGYSYDASIPAVEIRTPQILLRHVGKGFGPDFVRAHMTAANPPVDPGTGRVVVLSRKQDSAAGVLSRPLPAPEALGWLDRHPAGSWPLPTLKKRLAQPEVDVAQAEWVTFYDGPSRVVTITRGQAEHHAIPLEPVPGLAHENVVALRPFGRDRGTLVRLEVRLDGAGQPLAWPERLDPQLLGSPTLWPDPEARYGWWHRPEVNLAGRPRFSADARRLGPVLDRPPTSERHWPLWGISRQGDAEPAQRPAPTAVRHVSEPVPYTVEHATALPAGARPLMAAEGGRAYLLERSDQFLIVTAEFALSEEAGVPPCRIYGFVSEQDRLTYLEHRGWHRGRNENNAAVLHGPADDQRNRAMTAAAREALLSFGCLPEIVDLVLSAGLERPVVVKTEEGSTKFVPVAAGLECQAAMYAQRSRVYIALHPEDARRIQSLSGVGMSRKKNERTWRLKVNAADAGNATIRRYLEEAVALSLDLSLLRPARSRRPAR